MTWYRARVALALAGVVAFLWIYLELAGWNLWGPVG